MKEGLIIGKFMPLHKGHIALVEFGLKHCETLIILVSAKLSEPIPGLERLKWVQQTFNSNKRIKIEYTEADLPDSPVSSRSVSMVWSKFLSKKFPKVSILFSSEKYGDYLAEYMDIEHKMFDLNRINLPVSASEIRKEPLKNWEFIPPYVRSYFGRKVCIYGAESTGKSTLTEKLSQHFCVKPVYELARAVLGDRGVDELVYSDIIEIAKAHAKAILEMEKREQKLLFCDTDLITTKIYSDVYFNKVPEFPEWVKAANKFDFYLFCDTDVPWVKDIHRNLGHVRKKLRDRFEDELLKNEIKYKIISGSWENRFNAAVEAINSMWK